MSRDRSPEATGAPKCRNGYAQENAGLLRALRHASLVVIWAGLLHASCAGAEAKVPKDGAAKAGESAHSAPSAKARPKVDVTVDYWQAMKLFRARDASDYPRARALLDKAAAGELTHAQLFLAECYETGSYGYEKDPHKTANYLRLAAERGNAFAEVSFAVCLSSGFGVVPDDDKAVEWANAALAKDADYSWPTPPKDFFRDGTAGGEAEEVASAQETDPVESAKARAHFVLAQIYERWKQADKAQPHLVAAATAGVSGRSGIQRAAVLAAINYAFGQGVARDLAKANEMLEQSKRLARHAGISLVYNSASEAPIDDFAVADLEEQAAKQGDELAGVLQLGFGRGFLDRGSKDYDPAEARRWFELAAEDGQAPAMLELGLLYSGDALGPRDPAKAFDWFKKIGAGDPPKLLLGAANLVICYHEGLGTPRDMNAALAIARRLKDKDIVCYLATIDRCPKAVVTFEQEAALNREWAEKKRDHQAQYLWGRRFLDGVGVAPDVKAAAHWLEKAADGHQPRACGEVGLLYQTRASDLGYNSVAALKKVLHYYRRGRNLRDAAAISSLAYVYEAGLGVKVDKAEAERLYVESLAIDPKQVAALNNLGILAEERWRAAQKSGDAAAIAAQRAGMLSYYERAERLGSGDAANNLARLYYNGSLGGKDFEKAYSYYEKAAEQGDADAQFHLGEMHEKGEGVPVTYVEAAYHYRLAALDGHIAALRRLIDFYLEGKAGAVNFERARFWLDRLAEKGQKDAIAIVADVALRQEHYDEAVQLLEMLSQQKNPKVAGFACYRLNICYARGWGVEKNTGMADLFLNRAIDLGDPDAICVKAQRTIAEGKTAEAVALFEKAADESAEAAFVLGQMNFFGQYMPKNVPRALGYLHRAADKGYANAEYFLAGLTFNRVAGAPPIDEAIRLVRAADGDHFPGAAALLEKLEKRRLKEADKPQTTSGAQST